MDKERMVAGIILLGVLLLGSLFFIRVRGQNTMPRGGEMKTAPCGFKYKIVEIEGKRFIAFPTYFYWSVTKLDE